jgi:hypothetical protein
MTQFKGKITIGKYISNYENPTPVHIEIEDDKSTVRIVEVEMSLEDFADAVLGHGYKDCIFKIKNVDKLGKEFQHKNEVINNPYNFKEATEEQYKELLKPYEVDGWVGNWEGFTNYHNAVKRTNNYQIHFARWVKTEEE